jgi:hypothetical protein
MGRMCRKPKKLQITKQNKTKTNKQKNKKTKNKIIKEEIKILIILISITFLSN